MENLLDRNEAQLYAGDRVALAVDNVLCVGSVIQFYDQPFIEIDGQEDRPLKVNHPDFATHHNLVLAYRPDAVHKELALQKEFDNAGLSGLEDFLGPAVPTFLFEVERIVDTKKGLGVTLSEVLSEKEHADYERGGPGNITIGSTDKSLFDGYGPGEKVLVTFQLATLTTA